MEIYANYGGDSGVAGYDIEPSSIIIYFRTGATYLYTYDSASSIHIEQMKKLARAGSGLNEYINRYVKRGYEKKLR